MSEREEFEKFINRRHPKISLETYADPIGAAEFGREVNDYKVPLVRDCWEAWRAARASGNLEAVFVTGEPLYIRLQKDLAGGPDETFVEIEDGDGRSVRIQRFEDGDDWIVGPIYEAPKS